MNPDKIKTREEIARISEGLKKQGKTIVTTNGTFDLIHIGHVRSFIEAKRYGVNQKGSIPVCLKLSRS